MPCESVDNVLHVDWQKQMKFVMIERENWSVENSVKAKDVPGLALL